LRKQIKALRKENDAKEKGRPKEMKQNKTMCGHKTKAI
jgi:hypothetical protein